MLVFRVQCDAYEYNILTTDIGVFQLQCLIKNYSVDILIPAAKLCINIYATCSSTYQHNFTPIQISTTLILSRTGLAGGTEFSCL